MTPSLRKRAVTWAVREMSTAAARLRAGRSASEDVDMRQRPLDEGLRRHCESWRPDGAGSAIVVLV